VNGLHVDSDGAPVKTVLGPGGGAVYSQGPQQQPAQAPAPVPSHKNSDGEVMCLDEVDPLAMDDAEDPLAI